MPRVSAFSGTQSTRKSTIAAISCSLSAGHSDSTQAGLSTGKEADLNQLASIITDCQK